MKMRIEDMGHKELYTQIVNIIGLERVLSHSPMTLEVAKQELEKGNKPLNDIVRLREWDSYAHNIMGAINTAKLDIDKDYKGGVSLSDGVCTLKTALIMKVDLDK